MASSRQAGRQYTLCCGVIVWFDKCWYSLARPVLLRRFITDCSLLLSDLCHQWPVPN